MKNKLFLFSILALILVLFVAALLYSKLSKDYAPDQLSIQGSTAATQESATGETVLAETRESTQDAPTDSPAPEDTLPPLAPDFTVYDLDGNAVRLSDFRGKPVVVNFWASWCGPCQSEMPDFDAAFAELGEEIHFLMVNMTDGSRETVDSASGFIAEQGYRFPVYYDTAYEASIAYSVYSLPTTYFIDSEGYAIAQATGAINAETLQRGIAMIYTAD